MYNHGNAIERSGTDGKGAVLLAMLCAVKSWHHAVGFNVVL